MNESSPRSIGFSETPFARLWLARDVAALTDWVLFVALVTYGHGFADSPSTVSVLLLAFVLPPFLLGPLARGVVNGRSARAVGLVALAVRAAVMVPMYLLAREDGVRPVLVVAAAVSATTPFFTAAHGALLSRVSEPARRAATLKSLLNTGLLVLAAGPALGVVIYGVSEIRSAAIAVVAGGAASAAALLSVGSWPSNEGEDEPVAPPPDPGVALLVTGLFRSFGTPGAAPIVSAQLAAALLAGGLVVAEAAYTINGLFLSLENLGILLAGQGLGAAIGAAGYSRFGRQYTNGAVISTALALMAGGAFGLAISSALVAASALAGAIGLGAGIMFAHLADLKLGLWNPTRAVGPTHRRLGYVVEAVGILSVAAMGPLCENINARFTLVIAAILLATVALYAFGAIPNGAGREEESSSGPGPGVGASASSAA